MFLFWFILTVKVPFAKPRQEDGVEVGSEPTQQEETQEAEVLFPSPLNVAFDDFFVDLSAFAQTEREDSFEELLNDRGGMQVY